MKPVTMGKEVFIGAKSALLPVTEIGDKAITAVGSLAKGFIPSNTVFGYQKNSCVLLRTMQ